MSRPEKALKKWRTSLGLSQEAAGEMLTPAVSQAAWASWETGRKPPGLHNAFEIQRVTAGLIVASSWSRLPKQQERRAAKPNSAIAKAS